MKKILYILCATALVGCGGTADSSANESAAAESASAEYARYDMLAVEEEVIVAQEADLAVADLSRRIEPIAKNTQKIIKTGQMGLEVEGDISSAKAAIDALVEDNNGYYSSEDFRENDRSSDYSLSIRIPAERFEGFIATLESGGYGTVGYKNIDARDVTEEFLDITTRLDNKRSYLNRYRELLKRATTIKDIMAIEEQVRALEEEIESAEGRLRYLSDQTSYSTLDLTLSHRKEYVPAKSKGFGKRFVEALSWGWRILKGVVLGIITLWPLWIIAAAVLVPILRIRRKKRRARLQ